MKNFISLSRLVNEVLLQTKSKNLLRVEEDREGRLVLSSKPASSHEIGQESDIPLHNSPGDKNANLPTRLTKLYVEPTNQCNLDCRTCIRNGWDEPMGKMSDIVYSRIVEGLRAFSPIPKVFFGGFGEPLFHPRIADMVVRAKALGASVELITNATLLTADLSQELIRAGLDMLWVSLDGATPESYSDIRLGAALPKVLDNLLHFHDAIGAENSSGGDNSPVPKTRLGIAFVAMQRNIADLSDVIDIGLRFGAERFIVTNVLPYTRGMIDETLYYNIDRTVRTSRSRCPFIVNGAGAISWNGDLSPCLPLLHSHTSFLPYLTYNQRFSRRWAIGNVMEHILCDLWNTKEHVAFRERVHNYDFPPCTMCGSCELSENNESDCFGNNFPTCGGCLWAQGIIQCP